MDVLSAVRAAMSKYSTNAVTLTGHSLGAAIALLDSVYLPLHLPGNTAFKTVVYGLPRVRLILWLQWHGLPLVLLGRQPGICQLHRRTY